MRASIALLSLTLSASCLVAGPIGPGIIDKIQQARLELKSASGATRDCSLPTSPSCAGAEYCKELEKNADQPIIYKNAQGESIPNFSLLKFNDEFEKKMSVDNVEYSNDPLLNLGALQSFKEAGSAEAMLKNRKAWEDANEKAKPLLEETRQSILKILEARKNGSNNAAIDEMKKRIMAVRLATVQEVQAKDLNWKCGLPNARFFKEDHTIHVCPQLLRMPAASLHMVLAHEMGHAIDPCNISKDLYTDGKVTSAQATRLPTEKQNVARAGKMISAGVPFQSNPYSSVISCLQKPSSMSIPLTETLPVFEEYRACPEVSGMNSMENASMQEGFADWVSSQVIKNKVASIANPTMAKQYAFESQGVFLAANCSNVQARVFNKMTAKLTQDEQTEVKTRYSDLAAMQGDSKHQSSDKRMGRLFLTPKEMQKALNCKPTDAVECK